MKVRMLVLLALVFAVALQTQAEQIHWPKLDYGDRFVGTNWKGFDSPLYGTVFSQVTPANAGKWGSVEREQGKFDWQQLDAMYKLAADKHLIVKQHNMLWHHQQPRWVNPGNAKQAVEAWYQAYAARYGGKFDLVDVVNEPLDGTPDYATGLPDPSRTHSWTYNTWPYELARKYFPKAKLIVNDYGLLAHRAKTARFVKLIQFLKAKNLVDAIGCQAHGLEHVSPATLRRNLATLASLGLPIYISEYDINASNDQQQLEIMKTQFPIFWSDPHVRGVTFWGFKQGHMWSRKPNAYLIRSDGSPRPAFTWLVSYLEKHGKDGQTP